MKAKQLTFRTIGGEIVTRTMRGKHYIQPRGYAHHPGSGPVGETCATCRHCIRFRRWSKCDKARHKWTGGRASDILAKAPACKEWEKRNALDIVDATVLTEKEFLQLMSDIGNVD